MLLPAFATPSASAASTDGQGKAPGGQGFEGLLALLASVSPKAGDGQPASGKAVAAVGAQAIQAQLAQALQALAGGKVDLKAPGLGLTSKQLEQLEASLAKILKDAKDDGTQVLASLLAASQLAATIPAPQLVPLTKLLGTAADGSVAVDAFVQNVQLLAQAVQLVSGSGGQMTLLQAMQELAPKGDAFANQLADVLQAESQEAQVVDTGPPQTADPESEPVSTVAGSDGHESTAVNTTASPADGAAAETSQTTAGETPDGDVLAQMLEALVAAQQARSSGGSSQTESASDAAAKVAQLIQAAQAEGVTTTVQATGGKAAADVAIQFAQMLIAAAEHAPSQPGAAVTSTPGDTRRAELESVVAGISGSDGGSRAIAGVEGKLIEIVADTHNQGEHGQNGQQGAATGQGGQHQTHLTSSASDVNPVLAIAAAGGNVEGAGPQAQTAAAPQVAAVEHAVLEQIVQRATLAVGNGQQEFRIQLKPEFLGAMEIRVSISDGAAMVRMTAQNPATRQLIEANIGQLRQAFGTNNVRIEHVPSFSSSDAPWTFNPGSQQGFWQGQNPYDGSNRMPEAIPFSGEPEPDVAVAAAQDSLTGPQVPQPATAGGIDIQA